MYKCGQCDREFETAGGLNIHKYHAHTKKVVPKKSVNPTRQETYVHFCPCCGLNLQVLQTIMKTIEGANHD